MRRARPANVEAGTSTALSPIMLSRQEELKDRIQAKQRELEARFHELKADGRAETRDERDRLKSKLDELQETIKTGWDNMSERVSAKLNDWLNKP
jgi:hypothetical protein